MPMTEWGVVTVIIGIVGLFFTVGNPIIKLNSTITKLISNDEALRKDTDKLEQLNKEEHTKMTNKLEKHDGKLENHEYRIQNLEVKK